MCVQCVAASAAYGAPALLGLRAWSKRRARTSPRPGSAPVVADERSDPAARPDRSGSRS